MQFLQGRYKKQFHVTQKMMQEACDFIARPVWLHLGNGLLGLAFILIMAGCDDATQKVDGAKKEAATMEASPAQKRAAREAEFQAKIKDPLLTPVVNPQNSERSGPEAGFGVKTQVEIMREKERKPRIGLLGPLSGELEQYGRDALEGAELASEELDAAGGIDGVEYELLVIDTQGSIAATQKAVETLFEYQALAIVGAGTGEVSFAANKFINENQLIKISAGSRRRLGDTGPYNFRNTLDDNGAVIAMMDYIKENRTWRRFGIFSSVVNDYSVKLSAFYKAAILNAGMTVSHELFLWGAAMTHIAQDESSIEYQVAQLQKNPPDALIFTGSADEAVDVVKHIEAAGLNIPLIASEDIVEQDFIDLGKTAAGTLIHSGFNVNSDNGAVKKFVQAYTEKFNHAPNRLAALAYDSFNMVVAAIKRSSSLRPSHVREALIATVDYEGVTGATSVNEVGESKKSPFIFEFRAVDGEYRFVVIKEPF